MLIRGCIGILFLGLLGALTLAQPTASETHTLQLSFSSKKTEGVVFFAIFDNAKAHKKNKPMVYRDTIRLSGKKSVSTQITLPADTYSIQAFLDENGNEKMDFRGFLPKEPYGFSKNVRGRFGKPSFKATSFVLDDSQSMEIRLK